MIVKRGILREVHYTDGGREGGAGYYSAPTRLGRVFNPLRRDRNRGAYAGYRSWESPRDKAEAALDAQWRQFGAQVQQMEAQVRQLSPQVAAPQVAQQPQPVMSIAQERQALVDRYHRAQAELQQLQR